MCALKNYFLHRAREGGRGCVKTFILVRYKHQYQDIDINASKFQFILLWIFTVLLIISDYSLTDSLIPLKWSYNYMHYMHYVISALNCIQLSTLGATNSVLPPPANKIAFHRVSRLALETLIQHIANCLNDLCTIDSTSRVLLCCKSLRRRTAFPQYLRLFHKESKNC